jgi:hypothetical protein
VAPKLAADKPLAELLSVSNVNQAPRRHLLTATTSEKQSLFFNPFSSALLWAFTGIHLLFAILLGNLHAFAPDESYYIGIEKDFWRSGFSTHDALGWHRTQVWFLRILFLPTRLFNEIGFPDYLAIRFESVLVCSIAVYLLLCLLRANPISRNRNLLVIALLIPSCFVWMTLGLRECFIFLALALVCMGVVISTQDQYRLSGVFLTIGNLILFETKQILFLLSFGALLLVLAYSIAKRRKFHLHHAAVLVSIAIPIIFFPAGRAMSIETVGAQLGIVAATGQTGIAEYAESLESAPSESGSSTSDSLRREISEQPTNAIVKILKITGIDKKIAPPLASSEKVEESKPSTSPTTPARSTKLDVIPASVGDPLSIITRTVAFLFTPLPFIDNGSFFVNILALEAPLWWVLYLAVGAATWRRITSRTIDELTIFVLSYSFAFLLFSALTEINLGTLTRHRSVLLIPWLFLILATPRKIKTIE